MTYEQASRLLWWLLGIAVSVSVVHYLDNFVNYDAYPLAEDVPNPSATLIAVSWFVFTASGGLGVWLWLRRRIVAAAFAVTGYSVSGLVGFGHYAAPGAFDMVWWRQAHIVADICCGIAIFVFAVWAGRNADRLAGGASGQPMSSRLGRPRL